MQDATRQLEESRRALLAEVHDLRSTLHMTQLRAEKQSEWNDRLVAELRDQLQAEKGLIRSMISIEQYKTDLDHAKTQCQALLVAFFRFRFHFRFKPATVLTQSPY